MNNADSLPKKKLLKTGLQILKYLSFLGIGIFVFWMVYKDEPIEKYKSAFSNLNYFWIALSIILGMLSQVSRAMRWNMLIKPLGYRPKFYNSFLSVLILYFVNLLLPRAGEVFRCTVLSRYEKIPFTKLAGTVVVERMADVIMLMVLAFFIILSQFKVFINFFNSHLEVKQNLQNLLSARNIVLGIVIVAILLVGLYYSNKILNRKKISSENGLFDKIRRIKHNFATGIKSVAQLENKWYFIGHTFFIFLMWLFMLYVVFLAYEPTSNLSLQIGMITFLMGGLAMLAPVQGGIGPWHFMVYETLYIYGVDKADGKVFALIAHASTSLIYLFFGLIALILIPLVNDRIKKSR